MSATGRGKARQPRDLYETPGAVTRAILPYVFQHRFAPDCAPTVWEGAAGNGAIVRELIDFDIAPQQIIASDVALGAMPDGVDCRTVDFATAAGIDSIASPVVAAFSGCPFEGPAISNPPFKLDRPADYYPIGMAGAPERDVDRARVDGVLCFVTAAHRVGAQMIVVLARLNWWAGAQWRSRARAAIRKQYEVEIFAMAKRPSFTGGKTDNTEYAWLILSRNTDAGFDVYQELAL
jgi:hypothetical protein